MNIGGFAFGQTVRPLAYYSCDRCGRIVWSRDPLSGTPCESNSCRGAFRPRGWGRPKKKDGQLKDRKSVV